MNINDALHPGLVLPDGLRLVAAIGRGGMGEVWRAHDGQLGRDVAVKFLRPRGPDDDPDATDEFARQEREARACARVVHRNVVAVYGIGTFADRPYIVMEWLEGETLRDVIESGRRTSWNELRGWLRALVSAVAHAHDCGVVHCDIKPENVLLAVDASGVRRPKLVDFGIARGADLAHRRPFQHRGTAGYLAPEAGSIRPSPAGDQYSLAVTFVELLSGVRPIRRDGAVVLPRKPVLAGEVEQVFRRALAGRPTARFASVRAMGDALLAALRPAERPVALLGGGSDLDQLGDDMCIDAAWLAGLPRGQLRRVALAIIATAPAGFPEALRRIAALPETQALVDVLNDLRAEGWIEGELSAWRLVDPGLRDAVVDPLGGRVRRAVERAVADALALEPDQGWKHGAAVRLYIGAGDLDRAAALLGRQAEAATTALERDQVLVQRITLLGAPRHQDGWLDALLERFAWAIGCGWAKVAAAVVLDVVDVASRLGIDGSSDRGMRITALDAGLRMLRGDARRALSRLGDRLVSPDSDGAALHLAAAIDARVATGQHGGLVDGPAAQLAIEAGWPAVLRALGGARIASGDIDGARPLLRRALAASLDDGDRLGAATTMVALGEASLARGSYGEALDACVDADEILDSLGSTRWSGRTRAIRAEVAVARGDPIAAIRHMESARVVALQHGCSGDLRVYQRRADVIARRLVTATARAGTPA